MARQRTLPGWTLTEVLIAMAIVFTLTGTVGFIGTGQIDRARLIAAEQQLRMFEIALESYALDTGQFPTSEQGLDALVTAPVLAPIPTAWRGPYLRGPVPPDPWGEAYRYETRTTSGAPYRLTHSRSSQ